MSKAGQDEGTAPEEKVIDAEEAVIGSSSIPPERSTAPKSDGNEDDQKTTEEIQSTSPEGSSDSQEGLPDPSPEGNSEESQDLSRFVKVFILDNEGKWSDQGTGHADCVYVEKKESWCLVVRSDQDSSVLLNSTIRNDVRYVRQQETLLVWTECTGEDLALSFQDVDGCQSLWQELENMRLRLAADKHDIDQLPEYTNASAAAEEFMGTKEFDLPNPELGNLKHLERVICQASKSYNGKDALNKALERSDFLANLLPLFEQSEDLEDMESLFAISSIIRSIIFLNEAPIYEYLLRDEVFPTVLGILEYDGEFPDIRASHREHFEQHARFKQVVPIKNSEIRAKIVQTYRVQYLKDVALARLLDEATVSALLSMTFYNQVEVLSFVKNDASFLNDLFGILDSADTPDERKKEAVLFLHELFAVTKQLQTMNRPLFMRHCDPVGFHKSLINHGLFDALSQMFIKGDLETRTAIAAITANVIDHDANIVRSLTQVQVKTSTQQPFFELLVDRLLIEKDAGLRLQSAEMIRALLDTAPLDTSEGLVAHSTLSVNSVDDFLQLVYDKWAAKLVTPILNFDVTESADSGPPDANGLTAQDRAALCNHICDLLCFMIKQHGHRIKYLLLTTPIISKVAALLKAKQNYLRLSALRVLRVCIGMREEWYTTQVLLKMDITKHVMNLFIDVKSKYNLLNSACLELFEFLVKENPKPVVASLVTNFRSELENVTYVQTCKKLIAKHEQNIHPPPEEDKPYAHANLAPPRDGWKANEDEDNYFNMSDDEQEAPNGEKSAGLTSPQNLKKDTSRGPIEFVRASSDLLPGGRRPLVDYPDDDDDDDVIGALASRKSSSPAVTMSNESRFSPPASPTVSPSPSPGRITFAFKGAKEKRPLLDDPAADESPSKKSKGPFRTSDPSLDKERPAEPTNGKSALLDATTSDADQVSNAEPVSKETPKDPSSPAAVNGDFS
ncbi:hypothetical protein PhCBS80983_g04494 [Powellomyces hirtus]|uniref:Serine/threonine-protein phosphatase 4 regulatory subunit 3-like central domain-containing protein n=1 Tax=Powellomyces hirtus TaxID=109895 RepID=A0A507DZZ4_9FUNG|nr:hypothetical protein PhCBS80983_g04494 [Powellomyces hirtus]